MEELNNPQISQESKDKDVAKQTAYYPASDVCFDLKTVVPIAMSFEQKEFNKKIKLIIETNYKMSVAEYVADKLRYKSIESLCKAFGKEQIDAIATAIWNNENTGNGLVVADQTGVGKGRIGAGLIRYCILYMKKVPIFFTEKKHLINDIYRDLIDIGLDAGIPIKIKEEVFVNKEYTDEEILKLIEEEITENSDIVTIDFDFEEGDDFELKKKWLYEDENSEKVQILIELYRQALMEKGDIIYRAVSKDDYNKQLKIANDEGRILVKPFMPFVFNITDKNGNILYESSAKEFKAIIKSKKLPNEYKAIFLSYSQVSRPYEEGGRVLTDKMKLLLSYANDTLLILDESHAASGSATVAAREGNTTRMVKTMIKNAKMAIYISATFAKTPQNLPLYSLKTSIKESNLSYAELVDAFRKGKYPLQEAVSAELSKIGQLVRREKLIEGEVIYKKVDEDSDTGLNQINKLDRVAELFNKVQNFGEKVREEFYTKVIELYPDKETRPKIKWGGGTNRFAFLLFNYFILGLKIRQTCDEAIYQMSNGRKVIIAIANTLESAFDSMKRDFINDISYEMGDSVENDFSSYCLFLLNYSFRYTITDSEVDDMGKTIDVKKVYSIKDRRTELETDVYNRVIEYFREVHDEIRETNVGVPISPIDNIKYIIEKNEGKFRIEEITGRKRCLEFESDDLSKGTLQKRKIRKVSEIVNDFNANKIDCLIINQSGAVGLSMHSLPTKNNKGDIIPPVDVITSQPPINLRPNNEVKQRCMIVTQSELDINKEIQKLGRINRTGQLFSPIFVYLTSVIPSEKRLSSLMQKKLKSLAANVTGSQDQFEDIFDSEDLFGEDAVASFNETLDLLNYPIKKASTGNDIREFTKQLYFKGYNIQKTFYDTFTEIFNKNIKELIDKGLYNSMKIVRNYNAVIKNTYPFIIGNNDSYSSFGSHTYLTISDCMVYETKMLESNITQEIDSGHNIKTDNETLVLKPKQYLEWAEKYKVDYLKFRRESSDFSINNKNKVIEGYELEIETLKEDAKKFEDLPKAIELKEELKSNQSKLNELNEKVVLLIGEGKMDEVNVLAKEVQSLKSYISELTKKFEDNLHYEEIILRQNDLEKILKRIDRIYTYIDQNKKEIEYVEEQYVEDTRIASLFVDYVKNIGKIYNFQKLKEHDEYDENGEKFYSYSVMIPMQKVVLYDVKIDTRSIIDKLTLGSIHLKYFYVTGTDNFSANQVHEKFSDYEKSIKKQHVVELVNTDEYYINNWNDYVATINTGRVEEKLILNGNVLKAYSIILSEGNIGSILKYTLENQKLQTGIELIKDEADRRRQQISNDKYAIYFEMSETNYEKLVYDWIIKNQIRRVANEIVSSRGSIFVVTETPQYNFENLTYDDFNVHIITDKLAFADLFCFTMKNSDISYNVSQYFKTTMPVAGEDVYKSEQYEKKSGTRLIRDAYTNDETIFISNAVNQSDFNTGKEVLRDSFIISLTLNDFIVFLNALKLQEDITFMSITNNKVVEAADFYVFEDNSSNIAKVTIRTDKDVDIIEPLTPEVEKSLDELVNELVDLLK